MLLHELGPWVPEFIQSCKNNKTANQNFVPLQLSTIYKDKDSGVYKPRCRTVIFSDFLFNDKKLNILTFNTDKRSEKISESFNMGDENSSRFEACFYFKDTWEQYRLSGESLLITQELIQSASFREQNKKLLEKYYIVSPNSNDPPTDEQWQNEIDRQWKLLSRSSKSQYKKPQPGAVIDKDIQKQLDKIQRGVDGSKEDAGLENFAIVCLCIDEVDHLKLKDTGGGKRIKYKRIIEKQENGEDIIVWNQQIVCP